MTSGNALVRTPGRETTLLLQQTRVPQGCATHAVCPLSESGCTLGTPWRSRGCGVSARRVSARGNGKVVRMLTTRFTTLTGCPVPIQLAGFAPPLLTAAV